MEHQDATVAPATNGEVSKQFESLNQILAALNNKHGERMLQENRLHEARLCFTFSLALSSNQAETHNNLGLCLFRLKDVRGACEHYRRAITLDPQSFQAYKNLGNACGSVKDIANAIVFYKRALAISPNCVEVLYNMGNCYLQLQKAAEAADCFQRMMQLEPTSVVADNLGICFLKLGQLEEAIKAFRLAIQIDPLCFQAHNNLGVALKSYESLAHYEQAILSYRRAIEIHPDYADAYNNLGNALCCVGRIEEAQKAYETSVKLAPGRLDIHWNYASSRKYTVNDPYLKILEYLESKRESLPPGDKIHLHFTLAKAFQDLRQEASAFQHLLTAHSLKREQLRYDEVATLRGMERIREVFSPKLMEAKQGLGYKFEQPVFVVGMMRSGTTLIEQVLASHPRIFGAGERKNFLLGLIAMMREQGFGLTEKSTDMGSVILDRVPTLNRSMLRKLGVRYLRELNALKDRKDVMRIVDKMPLNFQLIGLIHLVFPNARIIHARRDPVDTCLSIFSQLFVEDQPYAHDLGELGRYYHAYELLMEHWRKVLPPGVMLEVHYEEMVGDFENQARRLVAHTGLEWHRDCLTFYKTPRLVRTASACQVRQPLYRTSVGRWRPAPDLLQPLMQGLT